MKSIFVPLTGMESDRPALEAAKALALSFGAKVSGVHARIDSNSALALVAHETSWRVEREENELSARSRAEFDRIFGAGTSSFADGPSQVMAVSACWREVEGFPLSEYAFYGRLHDLIVVARDRLLPEQCAEIIMQTGRPVIIAPPRSTKTIGEVVLVAWNNTPESARALTAAMPILARAKSVLIADIPEALADEPERRGPLKELRELLRLHDVKAEICPMTQTRGSEAEILREVAYGADCDLIVMGAYGHSRLREYVFGGVTREILRECAISAFMFH
ncbi:MAG: universal stress protein [Proteobacteria bacterium]|nr:universal stress protein [Pseudomonadota bacterium]